MKQVLRPGANAVLVGVIVGSALVAGVVEMFFPTAGIRFGDAVGHTLAGIPTEMYGLTGAGLVSYTFGRSYEKARDAADGPLDYPEDYERDFNP